MGRVGEALGQVEQVRRRFRHRPAVAALLACLVLGLLLTACAPLLPFLRLSLDAADAAHRVTTLQAIFDHGSSASLLDVSTLAQVQIQLDALSQDMFELNALTTTFGAPLAPLNPQVQDDRLLVQIGYDLAVAADQGVQVARTILTPLQGGALAAGGSEEGITATTLAQARTVLATATQHVQDAEAAYTQLDPAALPPQVRPSTHLGAYLHLLPQAPLILAELSDLLDIAPSLLGIGQPAYYLVLALDRSELRPIGGFAGNYGLLQLDDGKQSPSHPLALDNVYTLDQQYFQAAIPVRAHDCAGQGPQPPEYYWWWPVRNLGCQYGWGLRDAGLSPSFPTDAQTALQILHATPGAVPHNAPVQGVIAFTPVLIQQLLQVIGPITLPSYSHVVVTPKNLEELIHTYQLTGLTPGPNRKAFTHALSTRMLDKIKTLHGSQLRKLFTIALHALKSKDLQVYFAAPQAELVLQQLGLASDIRTGNGDGFYVVDTNDGGDKANTYVSEQQTDVVTLLPNGGAVHHLSITVTYDRKGRVFGGTVNDYMDMQRIYLPADASILGYSGFNPPAYTGVSVSCGSVSPNNTFVSTIATDCADDHGIHAFTTPVTVSDVPGRTMVMGALTLNCGPSASLLATNTREDSAACSSHPTAHSQTIYIEWYSPHAFQMTAAGHGTYSELVQEQPGSGDYLLGVGDYLTMYVDTSQLHSPAPQMGPLDVSDPITFQQLIGTLKPVRGFNHVRLDSDLTVFVSF
jgi:hypothetical protein